MSTHLVTLTYSPDERPVYFGLCYESSATRRPVFRYTVLLTPDGSFLIDFFNVGVNPLYALVEIVLWM